MLFTDTATIYNHYNGNWYRTILEGVQWEDKATKTVDSEGAIKITQEVILTVPFRGGYVPFKEYVGTGFTFGLKNLDVMVLGVCDKVITDSYTITNLKKDYKNAVTIYGLSDNTLRPLLKHWKVLGK